MKKVLLAVEPDLTEEIMANVARIEPFHDSREWRFETCPDAVRLLKEPAPDVLVLSRGLPGMDPFKLLEKVKKRFGKARIVLLIGNINERSRAYMKKAESLGLRNFVKGELPGERPYIFTVALQKDYDEVLGSGSAEGSPASLDRPESAAGARERAVVALAYGGAWQSDRMSVLSCKSLTEAKKKVKTADVILVSSRAKDAERFVKALRAAGVTLPVVAVGPYRIELINAGATGCVEEVDDVFKFLV